MPEREVRKLLLKRQAEWRRNGKSTDWLQGYARGFMRVGEILQTKRGERDGKS